VKSNVKAMLITFFDFRGVVHREWVPQGQTVNQHFYLEIMKRLRENVRKKRPESWKSGSWMLHHDNAPAHSSLLIRQFLAKIKLSMILRNLIHSMWMWTALCMGFPRYPHTIRLT